MGKTLTVNDTTLNHFKMVLSFKTI